MAKLRRNHEKQSLASSGVVKVGLFAAIFGALFWVFNNFSGQKVPQPSENDGEVALEIEVEDPPADKPVDPKWEGEEKNFESVMPQEYLPANSVGQLIRRKYFSLSYNEQHEQAEWVAYELTRGRLNANWEDRPNNFRPDPEVFSGSASPYDYKKSGYDRGHMVPAADMAFDHEAISQTFYMSNMCPQKSNFNKGIWRELEEQSRDWAIKFKHLYVVTGPVLSKKPLGKLGENGVSVPAAFFKILLDYSGPEFKAIGFVMPNEVSYKHVNDYAVSIDYIEQLTGFDFFADLLKGEMEKELEAINDPTLWKSSENRYQVRLEKWNKQ